MGWKNFNDRLALFLLGMIPLLWGLDAGGVVKLPEAVSGALIMTWGLIIQYYFRRQPPNNGTPGTPPS